MGDKHFDPFYAGFFVLSDLAQARSLEAITKEKTVLRARCSRDIRFGIRLALHWTETDEDWRFEARLEVRLSEIVWIGGF